jgi:DHA2 family multidrug resistance protein
MHRHQSLLLATIAIFCGIEFLQTGMIAFAAVPIMGEINASPEEYSLIGVFYACIAVLVIGKMSWLVERIGWRTYLISTVAVYVAGTVICALSHTAGTFGIGRGIMACGGAGFMTMARVLVSHIPPGPGRFTGIRVFAVALACGTAVAPLVASLAITGGHWQIMFMVLASLAVLGALLGVSYLPNAVEHEDARSRSDAGQMLLLGLGAFALLYALQRSYYDFYNDTLILIALGAMAIVALLIFLRNQHTNRQTLFRAQELRTPRYMVGVLLFSVSYMILGADNYILPNFLQAGLGFSWPVLGFFQSLGLLSSLATWLVMSRLLPKYPAPRKFFVVGFASLAAFGLTLSSLTPAAEMWSNVLPAIALHGCFVMLVLATTAMQTFKDVGRDDVLHAHAQQVKNMAAQLATAFGVAFATVFLQWRTTAHFDRLGWQINAFNPISTAQEATLATALSSSVDALTAQKMAFAQQVRTLAQQSSLLAGIDYFHLIVIIGSIGAVVSVSQRIFK